ncbi:MAG: hypothetical protein HON77_13085, partial [Gammaproteobacteria bacterium]|nr:hypothetical protein [Gammaproteobacteria bacterium]
MRHYFSYFSIYHRFVLAVGMAMTTVGYFAKPDQSNSLQTVAEMIGAPSIVDPEQLTKINPIAEMVTGPSSKNPTVPIVRDDIFYDGIFSDNLDGKGTITWPSRQIYRGDVRGGLPHGKGNMLFANGRTYTGELSLGKLHGKGELHWPDG